MEANKGTEKWVEGRMSALQDDHEWQPDVQAALRRFAEKRGGQGVVLRRWALVATIVVVACVSAMALPSPEVLAHRCVECSMMVWQTLAGGRAAQSALKPASERVMAPDFDLPNATGGEVKLSDLKGKVVLVNFWATWCEGCQVEIPWFVEFAQTYEKKGLAVVGISMDDDGWKSVRPWIHEKKVNYPIVIGSVELGKKFGLEGMPLTVLVGKDGKIADVHGGIVDKPVTVAKIKELLGE